MTQSAEFAPQRALNVLHTYPKTFNEVRPEGEAHRGVGSILGITEKLDWMQESGITAIWLGPIYKSPGLDGNYDIADYYTVSPELGTMADVEEMIEQAHAREINVIFDLVPNHTSDQSKWFEASSDPSHPDYEAYKDHYIWRDPIDGELPDNIVSGGRLEGMPDGKTVPNNWSSIFSLPQIDKVKAEHGGKIPEGVDIPAMTAWVWNENRQQLYLAEFMRQQPSLNWQNPAVRNEIKNVVRFWFDKGVDSFRVDVMNHIGKDTQFKDEQPAEVGTGIGQYDPGVTNPHDQWKQQNLVSHWPELGNYVHDLLSVLDEPAYAGRRLVFEDWMSALDGDSRLDSLRPDKATVFNFLTLLNTNRERWSARNHAKLITDYYGRLQGLPGAVPNQVTGNHDTDTLRTRLGSAATARAAHLMLAALPGDLYTWQGDMMGRPNMVVPPELQKDGDIGKRDGERVPMQWNATLNGGFSQAEPGSLWLPAVDKAVYTFDNIAEQMRDPLSPYCFVRSALLRRKHDPALQRGGVRVLPTSHADVLVFARPDPENDRRQIISITNSSQNTVQALVRNSGQTHGKVTLTTRGRQRGDTVLDFNNPVTLPPDAGYIIDSI